MEIRIDDLSGPEIADFLDQHIQEMRSVSPPESTHTLDLDGLKTPDVTFWSVWDGERLIACGALKKLDLGLAELKSMRTSPECRGNGVASDLLRHILSYAKTEGHSQLFLETGSMAFFRPARRLYEKFGFRYCAPFGTYKEDPSSVFMSLDLADAPDELVQQPTMRTAAHRER